jgi:hypothetical protein
MADKVKTGPVQEFVLTDWLRDGFKGMRSTMEKKMEKRTRQFDTAEFRAHVRNARKERLLAIRSLVDSAIEYVKGEETTSTTSHRE